MKSFILWVQGSQCLHPSVGGGGSASPITFSYKILSSIERGNEYKAVAKLFLFQSRAVCTTWRGWSPTLTTTWGRCPGTRRAWVRRATSSTCTLTASTPTPDSAPSAAALLSPPVRGQSWPSWQRPPCWGDGREEEWCDKVRQRQTVSYCHLVINF